MLKFVVSRGYRNETNPYITSDLENLEQAKVSSLICTDFHQWDEDVIQDLSNETDQQSILNITLTNNIEDELYRSKENSEHYSVRSAYIMLHAQKGLWHLEDNNSLWKKIWRLKAPPKVLHLVWMALVQCLRTLSMLYAKYVPVNVCCPIYNGKEETILHALVTCPFATQCCIAGGQVLQGIVTEDFLRWLEMTLN